MKTESASEASESAFSRLRDDGWFRETGKLAFTHDVNQETDGSAWGYPGGMIYGEAAGGWGERPTYLVPAWNEKEEEWLLNFFLFFSFLFWLFFFFWLSARVVDCANLQTHPCCVSISHIIIE